MDIIAPGEIVSYASYVESNRIRAYTYYSYRSLLN